MNCNFDSNSRIIFPLTQLTLFFYKGNETRLKTYRKAIKLMNFNCLSSLLHNTYCKLQQMIWTKFYKYKNYGISIVNSFQKYFYFSRPHKSKFIKKGYMFLNIYIFYRYQKRFLNFICFEIFSQLNFKEKLFFTL